MTKTKTTLIWVCVGILGVSAAGCGKDHAPTTDSTTSAPRPEITAWWKTDGHPSGESRTSKLTGEPLPGWSRYAPVDEAAAARGKALFEDNCSSCHSFGVEGGAGPDLQGVTHRDTPEWVIKFNSDPEGMVKSDPYAKELMAKYLVQMPNLELKPDELEAINAFFYQQDEIAVLAK